LSFLKGIHDLWDHLRGKGPAAAVALTIDLSVARDNKPFNFDCGGLFVEYCTGDLYARVNGPNGDGMNLKYIKKILYPFSGLYLTNTAQAGASARLLLLPIGMDADPPAVAAGGGAHQVGYVEGTTDISTTSIGYVDMDEMTVTLTTGANRVLVIFSCCVYMDVTDTVGGFRVTVDGATGTTLHVPAPTQAANVIVGVFVFDTKVMTAGSHTFKAQWRRYIGTGTIYQTSVTPAYRRKLTVIELLS